MGVSDGLGAEPEIDCSVGAIVWVRRRNGSWWPGRILGPEELSASHVMSPRSGTPVKLLGREDASVDWYNLEKSKRVKAFRCGEFDDCIERAESSQGVPIKKREKYARREDAILHALELEKQHLEKRWQKSSIPNSTNHKMATGSRKELANCSPSANYTGVNKTTEHSKSVNPKTQPHLGRLDSSVEDGREYSHQSVQKAKHAKQQSWEDDNPEAMPRMRGLQDFGLRIASSKRKVSADSHLHALPIGGQNTSVGGDTSCGKNSSAIKKKRTQGGLSEEPLAKKRDRRRPLLQVLQSSAKLPDLQTMQSDSTTVSVSMQGDKEHADGIYRAKRSRCVYLPSDHQEYVDLTSSSLDKMQRCTSQHEVDNRPSLAKGILSPGLVAVQENDSERDLSNPELGKEASGLSDPSPSGRYGGHSSSVFTVPEPDNMDGEELNESELSGFVSPLHSHEQTPTVSADIGGSNWQLKGKRNIRNLIKRPVEKDSVNRVDRCNGALQESIHEDKDMDGQIGMRHVVYQRHGRLNSDYDEGYQFENDSGQASVSGFGNRRDRAMLKANNMTDLDEDSYEMSPSSWEADRMSQLPLRQYQRDSDGFLEPIYTTQLGSRMGPMLLDVDLKVQASYQGERVPLVSLMSRLDGKAIIGHPIQIEKMEDGSSNLILSKHAVCDERPDSDGNAGLPPVWRTARRTTMHRVPRTHTSSALEGEEIDPHQYSDFESRPQQKKPFSSHGYKEKLVKKSSCVHQSLTEKNSPKKIFKKINLSSQKIRTLSSIATDQKPSGKSSDHKLSGKDCDLGVLIKSEKTTPPLACIPVKLVFSRILEAVGRPSMAQEATYRISTAGPADRNPVDKTSE